MTNLKNKCFYIIFILLASSILFSQNTELNVQEISRFAFTSHDWGPARQPIIRYPYVYTPNSYGFQVCVWDSTVSTFTEIANYGVKGMVTEMVAWQNCLLIAVNYQYYTDIQPDYVTLYKVDITDPYHPQPAGSLPTGSNLITYGNMRIVNDVLLLGEAYDGHYQGFALINPTTLSTMQAIPDNWGFEIIMGNHLITRFDDTVPFNLYSIDSTVGLIPEGTLTLPYPVNTIPMFSNLNSSTVGTQCGEGMILWHITSDTTWVQQAFIEHSFDTLGTMCNGYLVFTNYEDEQTHFFIYDISNPALPVLVNNAVYPPGLESGASVDKLTPYGSYIFHSCMIYGCVCLRLTEAGLITFVAKCYEYNEYGGNGRKYNDYILQSIYCNGVACFDISNLNNPVYAFSIFPGNTTATDICGDYLWVLKQPVSSTTDTESIYNITDLQNPFLVYSVPYYLQPSLFFNHNEPNCFYQLDNDALEIRKYTIIDNQASLVFSYPISVEMQTPSFVNNLLYVTNSFNSATFNLYIYPGFADNNPQPPTILPNYLPAPGDVYGAGDYLFIRNLLHFDQPCFFYNNLSNFQVNNDIFGFNFRNYVCMGRETGVSFYNTLDNPTGFQDEDFFLPEYSYSSHIEWDDNYLYLFSQDNIAIYTYTLTDNEDNTGLQANGLSLSNYPNPINPYTTLSYTLPKDGNVKISIYNQKGQLVKTLINEMGKSGVNSIVWNGEDSSGRKVAAGIYFSRLETNGRTITNKMVMLK